MALINRISRLFRADMHAVLDRIEEPDTLLRQAVREMEDEIANDEQRLKLIDNEQTQLTRRQEDIEQSLESIEEEMDICFESQKDELARRLIRRKLEVERLEKHLGNKQQNLHASGESLRQRLQENRTRFSAMQQKLELLAEDSTTTCGEEWFTPDITVRDDEVEVAFLREQQKRRPS